MDSFGPRGYPGGFGKGSYDDRPPEVSEQTVRPLHAYGALQFLRKQSSITKDRIGVQGWSHGGMTTLVTNDLQVIVYPGASHNFDHPSESKQSIPANFQATQEAHRRAEAFFRLHLQR